ncbi:MAG: helix-turn-helix transcriptional regulator [Actinobacteria bacterium]|nr:helix-turn-helix transcriptional regulator [Actinomycetota bacterium]MCA1740443.1 helix-turn-helix transcriptional regulator [Actinomycetota bacterium]
MRRYPEIDGARLRQLRLEQALTQMDLSRMTGVSVDAISRLENELRSAQISTIRRLAEALRVEPRELIKKEGGNV